MVLFNIRCRFDCFECIVKIKIEYSLSDVSSDFVKLNGTN